MTAALKIPSERREAAWKIFFVSRREQQKAGIKITGASLVIAEQYFQELQKNPMIRENFGKIKSPEETPPNERSDGWRPNDERRAEIPEDIRPGNKSG